MGLLGGVLTGLLGDGSTPTPNAGLGLLPTLSLGLPTLSLPGLSIPGLSPTTSSSPSAASVTIASTSSPASSSLPLSISSTSSPSVSPSSASLPPTSIVPSSTTAVQDVSTGANGAVKTLTNLVTVDASSTSASQSATATPATSKSFLQNKPLSGTVFGIIGLLALIVIFTIATYAMRRRARNRLLDDAVSFDPGLLAAADEAEKGHARNGSLRTMGSNRPMIPAYGNYPAMPQYPEYYGGQHPAAYASPPPMAPAAVIGQHNSIPRVPVPPTHDLVGSGVESHQENRSRDSIEESEFWARTLKVTNQ